MKYSLILLCVASTLAAPASSSPPLAKSCDVTYQGCYQSDVESFIGIRYARDTGGGNRFKPPVPYTPEAGSTVSATKPGPACPQATKVMGFSTVSAISEDCLRLNVWRPNGTTAGDKLPVLVWIYGGSLIQGDKDSEVTPGGMILQSVANGHPIMHVELNYRLGVFGFAQSAALRKEGSENAGIRDMRLATEWVHENIAAFGGDPEKITLHGQSSGGLGVGMQILAYGAAKPYPFQQAICESGPLDLGITGNATRIAMAAAWAKTPCNMTALDSTENVDCLRNLSMDVLLEAQLSMKSSLAVNNGDQWLPTVDGDFLPAAPSSLLYEHRFANLRTMIGWCEDDALFLFPLNISTPEDCQSAVHSYAPDLTAEHLNHLLSLYPSTEFHNSNFANGTLQLHAETYRCGRIFRDLAFTCQSVFVGERFADAGNEVYLYDQNQTAETTFFELVGRYGIGVGHTSELPFIFGNLSIYSTPESKPTESDYRLRDRESRSWSSFVAVGRPSLEGHDTLQGWRPAAFEDENYGTYLIGGPFEGYSGSVGGNPQSRKHMADEKLWERCRFINSPEIVQELGY